MILKVYMYLWSTYMYRAMVLRVAFHFAGRFGDESLPFSHRGYAEGALERCQHPPAHNRGHRGDLRQPHLPRLGVLGTGWPRLCHISIQGGLPVDRHGNQARLRAELGPVEAGPNARYVCVSPPPSSRGISWPPCWALAFDEIKY